MENFLDLLCPTDFPVLAKGGAVLQALAKSFDDEALNTTLATLEADEDPAQLADVLMLAAARIDDGARASTLACRAASIYADELDDADAANHAMARALQRQPEDHQLADALEEGLSRTNDHARISILLDWQIAQDRWDETVAVDKLARLGALALDELQDPAKAIQAWTKCLELDPGRTDCSDRLASLTHAAGMLEQSKEVLSQAIVVGCDDQDMLAAFHVRVARILLGHGHDVANAARHLQAAIKINPDNYEALRAFGLLYLESGKNSEEGREKAASVFVKAGRAALREGVLHAATLLLRRALGIDGRSRDAFESLESVLVEREMWIQLDEHYVAWLEVADEALGREVLLRRAENLYSRLARREDARICFEEVRQFQSPDGSAWNALASIYLDMSDWTAYTALLEAQHEVLDDELDVETLLSAAQTYRDHLDNDERAAHFFYAILARDPFHTAAFEGYKEHWRRKQNWGYLRDVILYQIEQAESEGEDGPIADPAFAEEFVELADICERRIGDVSGALDAWRRLAEHSPGDTRPATQISRIEKRSRMWDNMVKVQEAELARTTDPKSRVAILKRLVQIYRDRQVDPERAIELYKEILETAPEDRQSQRALTALYDRASRYDEVVEMLEAQYERSRSRTERGALLRRLGELWHHILKEPDRAIWACETILEENPSDIEAMHRLQLIHHERKQWNLLLKVMSSEVKVLESLDDKMALLRRMARIAGTDLKREDLAFKIWKQLHGLDPSNLEIVDTLASHYNTHGPDDALAELLDAAGNAESTPKIRQLDYALRLGWLARDRLVDIDRAQEAFERALELRDDHRGALQALADIYREKNLFAHLCVVLEHLQATADTEGETWSLASERANYLVEHLDRPEDAAAVLVAASRDLVDSGSELNLRIMDCYEAASDHRALTLHAELALLSSDTMPERAVILFEKVIEARMVTGDLLGALTAVGRGLKLTPTSEVLRTHQLRLLENSDRFSQALDIISSRSESSRSTDERLDSYLQRSEIQATRLLDLDAAQDSLALAFSIDPDSAKVRKSMLDFARANDRWPWIVSQYSARFTDAQEVNDLQRQYDLCGTISRLYEDDCVDGPSAYEWAERQYEVFDPHQPPATEALRTVRRLAEEFGLWEQFAATVERGSGVPALKDHLDIAASLLLEASQVCTDELSDPKRAVTLLERIGAPGERPEAEQRIEALCEAHNLHEERGRLLERRIASAGPAQSVEHALAFSALCLASLDDGARAFGCLEQASARLDFSHELQEKLLQRMQLVAEETEQWGRLAEHLGARATVRINEGNVDAGVADIRSAADMLSKRSGDHLAALRLTVAGLGGGPSASPLLMDVEELAERVDQGGQARYNGVNVGSLALLAALEAKLSWPGLSNEEMANIFDTRAMLRSERLKDLEGAVVESVRALSLQPNNAQRVSAALDRSKEAGSPYHALVTHGLVLENAASSADRDDARAAISKTYEDDLRRPDLSLRSALVTWEAKPAFPADASGLDPQNKQLWALAAAITQRVERDVVDERGRSLELPRCEAPELVDVELWTRAQVPPVTIAPPGVTASPSIHRNPAPQEVIDEASSSVVELIDEDELESLEMESLELESLEMEELEELEDIEELEDLEDLEEAPDEPTATPRAAPTRAGPPARSAPPRRKGSPPRAGPPPTGQTASTHMTRLPLPVLREPLVPAIEKPLDAWSFVAERYHAAGELMEDTRIEALRACARMWEYGAHDASKALDVLENALSRFELQEDLMSDFDAVADRHGGDAAKAAAYERVLAELASPSASLALRRALARMYEDSDDSKNALVHYESICSVDVSDGESLDAYIGLLERSGDLHASLTWQSTRIQKTKDSLTTDEYVEQAVIIAERYADDLEDTDECIARLVKLIREFPEHHRAPTRLAQIRFRREEWPKGIDVLKTALENVDNDAFVKDANMLMAGVYEEHLNLPARAIVCWERAKELDSSDLSFLEPLKRLYIAVGRADDALALVDDELQTVADEHTKLGLLRTKADALYGSDEQRAAWAQTSAQILELDDDDDETRLRLVDWWIKERKLDEAEELLRGRLTALDGASDAHLAIGLRLVDFFAQQRRDKAGAFDLLEELESGHESTDTLRRARTGIARAFDDLDMLVEVLSAAPDAESWLEAGTISLFRVKNYAKARELLERVIEHEISQETDGPARLLSASESMAKLYEAEGRSEEVVPYLENLLTRKGVPDAVIARILSLLAEREFAATGDLSSARQRFEGALDANPDEVSALTGLARLLASAGKHEEALPFAERAMALLPREDDAELRVDGLLVFSDVVGTLGKHGEAYRKLTAALREQPDDPRLRLGIAKNRMDANRYKDVVACADQLRQWLEGRDYEQIPAQERRVCARTLSLASRAERELGREEPAMVFVHAALELDGRSESALEQMLEMASQKDRFHDVFSAADALRDLATDPETSDELRLQMLSAGPLAVATGEADEELLQRISTRTLAVFSELLVELSELSERGESRAELHNVIEAATSFALQERAIDTALKSINYLIETCDDETRKFEFHLSAAKATNEGQPEVSLDHCLQALLIQPGAPLATQLQLLALHALGRAEEGFEILRETVPGIDAEGLSEEEREALSSSLLFWARESSSPGDVAHAIQAATTIDPNCVGLEHRLKLAEALDSSGSTPALSLDNHRKILLLAPSRADSLRAVARISGETGDLLTAYASHEVLLALHPDEADSRAFITSHQVKLEGASAPEADFSADHLQRPGDAGVSEVLQQVWSAAAAEFVAHLSTHEYDDADRVSAVDDSNIARCWSSALKRTGTTKAVLVRGSDDEGGELAEVLCQHPPVIRIAPRAESAGRNVVIATLLRALAKTRLPDVVFVGLPPEDRVRVLRAIFRVLHPRYARSRSAQDPSLRPLVQDLARTLPMKLSRALGKVLEAGTDEPFDTASWETYVERRSICFALGRTFELSDALESLGHPTTLTRQDLSDRSVEAMLAFHTSDACCQMRRSVGYRCVARPTNTDGSGA